MNRYLKFPSLYSVATFRRNRSPKSVGQNEWLATGFGKIGILQQGVYLPPDVKAAFANPELTSFTTISRICREFKPGSENGSLLLHPMCVIPNRQVRMVTATAATANLKDGTVVLTLNDEELRKTMVWSITVKARRGLMEETGSRCLIADNTCYIKERAKTDDELAYAIAKSVALLDMVDAG